MFQNTSKLSKEFFSKDKFYIIIIFFVAVAFISPMIFLGIPDGNKDFPQHLQFASAYYDAFFSGDYLPVWSSAENYGFGSIGIRVYPPLASFALALIKALTGNWFDSLWITFLIWMFVGCVGIYFLAREWVEPKNSAIAAVLYVIVPYHLLQIYQMWLYAEFVAAAILPFCFLFITRICRRDKLLDVLLFAVAYSLLLLTHIPSTIIGSMSLGVYALFLIDWKQYKKTFSKLIIAFILSLSATVFYWIKVVTEIDWVQASNAQFSSGYYDPQKHLFPTFIRAGASYIESLSSRFDVSIFLTILLFLPAFVFLALKVGKNNCKDKKVFIALSVTGLFSIFMMSLPSSFIWSSFPPLQKIQFPWRWLSILSIISVLTVSFAASHLNFEGKIIKKISLHSVLFVSLSIFLFDVTELIIQSEPLPRTAFEAKLPELFNEPGCECWWTKWAKGEAFEKRGKVFAGSRDVQINIWNNKTREFTIENGQPTDVRVATFYYPYWKAQVNSVPVEVEKDENGAILFPVGSEESKVILYFQEPLMIKVASILSLLTWLLIIGAFLILLKRKTNPLALTAVSLVK